VVACCSPRKENENSKKKAKVEEEYFAKSIDLKDEGDNGLGTLYEEVRGTALRANVFMNST